MRAVHEHAGSSFPGVTGPVHPSQKQSYCCETRYWSLLIFDGSKFVYLAQNTGRESLKIDFYVFSALRSLPEALQTGPVGGKSVSKFPAGREDHAVVQLHPSQQPAPAPHLHARNVVSVLLVAPSPGHSSTVRAAWVFLFLGKYKVGVIT